jgi:XTP/dITP diphosphohydrolase
VERRAREIGVELKDMTLAQMDELWNEAKALEQN